ncbi:proton-coupled folate transporter-like [Hyposmocoma kahamanoa]|uniref:proton-coupled folate transporter-like n=1 Tax=Hyposmocoma kahamanoa TaxID=1477025 RepID=UPI000E6D899C|nr:proton-coupled folate transporter-like [Hyposmocoma kahamanoa]
MAHEVEPLKAQKPQKTSLKARYQSLIENITIEPVLACSTIPGTLARLATQNLNLDKACRLNLKYGDAVCDALIARKGDTYRTEETAVQEVIAGIEIWQNILYHAMPCFIILFIGAWSDRTGRRKIYILLPIVGNLLTCISNIVNTYFFYELPLELCMFMEAFCPCITGGWVTLSMGAFSYISDVSSEETRTFRMGIASLCFTACRPIGMALSGVLLKKMGYYGVFSLSALLYAVSIVYGVYYIKDPNLPRSKEVAEDKGFLRTFFDLKHVKNTITVVLKKGPNRRRFKSIMVLVCLAIIDGPNMVSHRGHQIARDFALRYLYSRYRFNWDAVMYSFYVTVYIILHSFGALVSISIFSRKLHWDDSVLGLISNISRIAGALVTGLAQNSFHMYLAVAIETFNATSTTALRSISSKLVSRDEIGKLQSVFNLTAEVASLTFVPLYSWMYMVTLKYDAGFVYYVSAGITVIAVFIFGWFYKIHKESMKKRKSTDSNNCEDIKDKNDRRNSDVKKKEDLVTCGLELMDEQIIVQ